MITTLLAANRGEIARRIFRTASLMGIRTVAVYADGDRDAPFVADADQAVSLPGRTAGDTYLRIEAILSAAKASGADAVHPGYGFLSERADLARAVIDAGLTWVGPSPEAIAVMGDKIAAKKLMAEAGVPVLPRLSSDDARFPLVIKASAGGGGKGMRVVESEAGLADALAAAEREAQAAFGDGTVFMEPYLTGARHVEIQIVADSHGRVVPCFERECSIQRRHQKIIEESPSTAVDGDLRRRMGDAAVAAAQAVGYVSAGTVEFVLDDRGEFWFLEVNTRLQVEHPVTEAVTGLDLVREQLLVAQGLPLSIPADGPTMQGHAIEARLYAEDPAAGFLPATGTLVDWRPAHDPEVRWDSGVEAGSVVGVEFDPMLAKVIAHAPTRSEAAGRLALALERSRIRGVRTNRDFLVATLRNPSFLAGDTTTDFIERAGVPLSRPVSEEELRLAGVAAALSLRDQARAGAPVLRSLPAGWRNSVMPAETVTFVHPHGRLVVGHRSRRDESLTFTVDDWTGEVQHPRVRGGEVAFECDGVTHRLDVLAGHGHIWVQGREGDVDLIVEPRFPEQASDAVAGGLLAPMPGRVVSVAVTVGDAVEPGQLLMIVEAMKMEHRVVAPEAGAVTEVRAAAGEQVQGGDLLVVIEPAEAPA